MEYEFHELVVESGEQDVCQKQGQKYHLLIFLNVKYKVSVFISTYVLSFLVTLVIITALHD